mgnify:CR=1 FL=1|tara:strand:+ start:36192 stop:36899 length:708 start_codon:yes stop_codon:yes gene_type:complete
MQLFYNPTINKNTHQITFDKIESKHIVKVLRKKEGDVIFITNGKGQLYHCKIMTANDKKCLVTIFNKEEKKQIKNYYLHIAIAPPKKNDRLEWFIEKATEIGVDEITPIICQNSERRFIKKDRLEKIIIAAMKQSLKFHLPKLNEAISFDNFLAIKNTTNSYIAHCAVGNKKSLKTIIKPAESTTILIGPEGDFSSTEITKSEIKNYIPITLGKTRLRTETAALVAVQNISFINQ